MRMILGPAGTVLLHRHIHRHIDTFYLARNDYNFNAYPDGQAILLAIIRELDDKLGASLLLAVVKWPETAHHPYTILRRHLSLHGCARHSASTADSTPVRTLLLQSSLCPQQLCTHTTHNFSHFSYIFFIYTRTSTSTQFL